MNGFERELRTRILSVTAHATLSGLDGALADWRAARAAPRCVAGRDGRGALYRGAGHALARQRIAGAAHPRRVAGGGEHAPPDLRSTSYAGRSSDLRPAAIASFSARASRASSRRAWATDVVLVAPRARLRRPGLCRACARFRVVGLFESGMYEFDRGLALVHLADAARLYRLGDRVSGIRLALADPQARRAPWCATGAGARRRLLHQRLDPRSRQFFPLHPDHQIHDVHDSARCWSAVAAFNIVATLVMIVKEKQTDIAILRTLGARPAQRAGDLRRAGRVDRLGRHASAGRCSAACSRTSCSAGGRPGARCCTAVSGCARLFHERAAGLRGRARCAAVCACRFYAVHCSRRSILRGARRARTPAEALRHD